MVTLIVEIVHYLSADPLGPIAGQRRALSRQLPDPARIRWGPNTITLFSPARTSPTILTGIHS